MNGIPMRVLLYALTAATIAPVARGQVDLATQAKILADPGYRAYDEKHKALLRSGLRGEAMFRQMKALQDANRAVIEKAFRAAGAAQLLSGGMRLTQGTFAPPVAMDGDWHVYAPPFDHRVANNALCQADASGNVGAETDTDGNQLSDVTYRGYVGTSFVIPSNVIGMVVAADVDVYHAEVFTHCSFNSATGRASVMVQAQGALPGDGFFDTALMEQFGSVASHDNWGTYSNPGVKHVSSTVVPVVPGRTVTVAAGLAAWGHSSISSDVHVGAIGKVTRILVKFIAAPVPTPTPIQAFAMTPTPIQAFAMTPTPVAALNPGLAQKLLGGPADVALFALPSGNGWPTELVVKNLGGRKSDSTIVRAKVVLTQGDLDVVAQNCKPRFVDFDEAVPALAPGASTTISLVAKIGPEALAVWQALNKPVRTGVRPAKTPTPNPVETIVVCRYTMTAGLGTNQNVNDPQKQNNQLTRDIVENVLLK
jgi:hypothetical protein